MISYEYFLELWAVNHSARFNMGVSLDPKGNVVGSRAALDHFDQMFQIFANRSSNYPRGIGATIDELEDASVWLWLDFKRDGPIDWSEHCRLLRNRIFIMRERLEAGERRLKGEDFKEQTPEEKEAFRARLKAMQITLRKPEPEKTPEQLAALEDRRQKSEAFVASLRRVKS